MIAEHSSPEERHQSLTRLWDEIESTMTGRDPYELRIHIDRLTEFTTIKAHSCKGITRSDGEGSCRLFFTSGPTAHDVLDGIHTTEPAVLVVIHPVGIEPSGVIYQQCQHHYA